MLDAGFWMMDYNGIGLTAHGRRYKVEGERCRDKGLRKIGARLTVDGFRPLSSFF
jgi:hypothetical protein